MDVPISLPAQSPPWWRRIVTRRLVLAALATALGVSCPFWPAPAKPVCEVIGLVFHAALTVPAVSTKQDGAHAQ